MVTDGVVRRGSSVRLLRGGVVVHTGELDSLKRFKDDVREVKSGFECGLSLKNFNEIQVGDQLECSRSSRSRAPCRGEGHPGQRARRVRRHARTPMKRHSQRAQRVGDQIQRELAPLLREEVKDPRVGQVTVTSVEVSADLSHAKVFFTHLAGRDHAEEAVQALQRTAGFLRTELSHRLKLYSVPQLHFAYDDSIESGMRLSQLIDDAVAADRRNSGPSDPET